MVTRIILLILFVTQQSSGNANSEGNSVQTKNVTIWNKTGILITICLKSKVNCYEGHPCCNWQAYRWIAVDGNRIITVQNGEILNFRYNKNNGDICAAGTVEFVVAGNPGQKSEVYLR